MDQTRLMLLVSFTHLNARLKQTIIATVGVVFGITVYIFLLSYVTGVNRYVHDMVLEQTPDLRLYSGIKTPQESLEDKKREGGINFIRHIKPQNTNSNIKNGRHIINELTSDKRIEIVSGSTRSQIFYNYGSLSLSGLITGIEFEEEDKMFNLTSKTIKGDFSKIMNQPNSIVLGSVLAKKMSLDIGDKIALVNQSGGKSIFTIVGIFQTGMSTIDGVQSYASLQTVQNFINVPSSYMTDIKMRLKDKNEATELGPLLAKKYSLQSSDWLQDNIAAFEGESLQNAIINLVAICILMVAGFGIFNILNMMIYEKMRDIAILKAMGFTDKDVKYIFLLQAFVIGLVGSVIGLIFGFICSYILACIPYRSETFQQIESLPVSFSPLYYITGFCFGLLTTFLSGYFPSKKAKNIDPISILKG